MEISVKDKVIVVSGGTKGVGKAVVKKAASEGAKILFSGRDEAAAKKLISSLDVASENVAFKKCDLINPKECEDLFKYAYEKYEKIDGFFSYSGITPISPLDSCSFDLLDQTMRVNFYSAFMCCQYAINYMQKNNGGSIVITGSPHAWNGEKDRAAYACSKGALLTLMNHIAHNYACDNIRCNYLTMGWTLTEGEINLRKNEGKDADKFFLDAAEQIPMKRMCIPEDYVEQILYLLSDSSEIMTGSVLQMTGGLFI